MSNLDEHIDAIFKAALQNIEVTPNPALWAEIAENLPQKKKKKRVIPLWLWPAGIAASLVLLLVLKTVNSDTKSIPAIVFEETEEDLCPDNNEIVFTEIEEKQQTSVYTKEEVYNSQSSDKAATSVNKKKEASVIAIYSVQPQNRISSARNTISSNGTIESENLKEQDLEINNERIEKEILLGNELVIATKEVKSKNNSVVKNSKKKPLEATNKQLVVNEILGDNLVDEQEKEMLKSSSKKWSIQPQVAPLVYNSTSGNSSIEANFQNQVSSTEAGISLGIKVAYQASPKWQIRSGISTANIDVFTNQVMDRSIFSGDVSSIQLNDFTNETPVSSPNFSESPIENEIPTDQGGQETPSAPVFSSSEGVLQQQISYIEIPVEITYRLLDKRFGTSVIAGASAFVLNQNNNEIFFEESGSRTLIGRSNNLNKTSFSGNIGVGLDYKITKGIRVSIEPTVKFQFNAFDATTDFNPYIFGVYSGIKFKL